MYNRLCEYKDTEENITYYYIVILRKTQHCTGGAILPNLFSLGCRPVSVSPEEFCLFLWARACNPCQR